MAKKKTPKKKTTNRKKSDNSENSGEINPKHREFAIEYAFDCNATRAYRVVYGTKNDDTARVNGHRLLTNADVRALVDQEIDKKLQGRRSILKMKWINEVEKLATANLEDFLNEDGYPDIEKMRKTPGLVAQFEDIQNITTRSTNHHRKIKLFSKEKALEMLGKHTGMLKEDVIKIDINQSILNAPKQLSLDEWNKQFAEPSS